VRKLFLFIIVFCGVILTGCTQLVELSDQESDMLTEYMAGIVLKHDVNYDDALLDPEDIANVSEVNTDTMETVLEPAATVEPTASVKPLASVEPAASLEIDQDKPTAEYVSLSEVMGKSKFSITYDKYAVYDSYPNYEDNNYFTLETSADRQLLMVSFHIKNKSNKTQTLNLIESDIQYQLDMDAGAIYQPMMTLLVNDIQYINLHIAAGETKEAVIVFDVLRDADLSNTNLVISMHDKETIIKIK